MAEAQVRALRKHALPDLATKDDLSCWQPRGPISPSLKAASTTA